MALLDSFARLRCDQISINRADRQRRKVEVEDLLASIKRHGVIQPIVVSAAGPPHELKAGERRLTACLALGLPDIPVRFYEDLDPIEAQLIELEENLKRKDLSWQDNALAVLRIHGLYCARSDGWTQGRTADMIGLGSGYISECLRVGRELAAGNPKIAGAPSIHAAYNMLSRVDARGAADAMSDILEAGADLFDKPGAGAPGQAEGPSAAPAAESGGPAPEPGMSSPPGESPATSPRAGSPPQGGARPGALPSESILEQDFVEWARTYTGPRFNFIHCDFPYGDQVFAGPQSGRDKWTTYDDGEEVYWRLIEALCHNLDRLMTPSAHLMFWLTSDVRKQAETLRRFQELAPGLIWHKRPLVWVKSDNAGVLADPKRGPRNIIETALFASREDRLVVKATSNAYSSPTNKDHHPSTKPVPMLKYFFGMFVDEGTRLLDPTCGSGAALRAAEDLGAQMVLGLERDPEHASAAKSALRQFRALKRASGGKA
jgi:ParB/RepB/Spo0J family partition protein